MKYLLLTLAIFLFLAQVISGNFFLKKCANRYGNCRKRCKNGELHIQPPTSMCPKEKLCCILPGKELYPLICGDNLKTTAAGGTARTMTTMMGSISAAATPAAGTQAPLTPVDKTPMAKTPVAQTPVAQTPVATTTVKKTMATATRMVMTQMTKTPVAMSTMLSLATGSS